MRYSVIVAGRMVLQGTAGRHEAVDMLRSDRAANGEGFAGEAVVRLPRRLNRPRPYENEASVAHRINAGAFTAEEWTERLRNSARL